MRVGPASRADIATGSKAEPLLSSDTTDTCNTAGGNGDSGDTAGKPSAQSPEAKNAAAAICITAARPQPPCNTEPARVPATVNFRTDASMKAALEAQAKRLNLTTSELLRNLVVAHFATAEASVRSATPPSAPAAPLRDHPLIVSGLAAFHEATAQTGSLFNDHPTAPGIAHVEMEFRRASKLLDVLAEDDMPPMAILNILRDVRNTVVPTLPALRQMRADIEGARPTVNMFACHLHAARDRLQELIWSCERFC